MQLDGNLGCLTEWRAGWLALSWAYLVLGNPGVGCVLHRRLVRQLQICYDTHTHTYTRTLTYTYAPHLSPAQRPLLHCIRSHGDYHSPGFIRSTNPQKPLTSLIPVPLKMVCLLGGNIAAPLSLAQHPQANYLALISPALRYGSELGEIPEEFRRR